MNKRTKGALALVAAAAVASGVVVGVADVHADTQPPWQSGTAKSPDAVGTITLYNSSGVPVTSGDIGDPIAAYAVGSGGLRAGDSIASLAVYTPYATEGPANADDWSGSAIATPTSQAGLPAFADGPTVNLAGSVTVAQYLGGFDNTVAGDAYHGAYELRLTTGAPGRAFSTAYDVLDIQVSGDQWHLYGEGSGETQPQQTTATLTVTPTTVTAGTAVQARVTVAPPTAGTVTYFDGATQIGSSPINDQGQQPAVTTLSLAAGAHAIKAHFAPTNAEEFAADDSDVVTVTVAQPGPTAHEQAVAHAQQAYNAATTAVSTTKSALTAASKPKAVKPYVKALAKQAKAEAKVTKAKAKVTKAKTKAAKKKAKKALTKAKKALTKAKKATKKVKKKAGAAGKKYDAALKAYDNAVKTKAAKAAALAAAKAGK